jgi:hypothetical protein
VSACPLNLQAVFLIGFLLLQTESSNKSCTLAFVAVIYFVSSVTNKSIVIKLSVEYLQMKTFGAGYILNFLRYFVCKNKIWFTLRDHKFRFLYLWLFSTAAVLAPYRKTWISKYRDFETPSHITQRTWMYPGFLLNKKTDNVRTT